MNKDIADLKNYRKEGVHFYDNRIKKIKGLSSKLNTYDPGEQLKTSAKIYHYPEALLISFNKLSLKEKPKNDLSFI